MKVGGEVGWVLVGWVGGVVRNDEMFQKEEEFDSKDLKDPHLK